MGLRILYLEDNNYDAELTLQEFRKQCPEHEVVIAGSLAEGRLLLAAGTPFDVALLDMHLHDGTGLEFLVEMRDKQIPIAAVMLPGAGDQESAVAAIKAGADDYIVKRNGYLKRLPGVVVNALAVFSLGRGNSNKPINVLYIDNDQVNAQKVVKHVRRYSPLIRLKVLEEWSQALLHFKSGVEHIHWDILLIDLASIGNNLHAILIDLSEVRKKFTKIILLSPLGEVDHAVYAMRLGFDEFVVKHPDYLNRLPLVLESTFQKAELEKEKEALRISEERFRRLSENAQDIIYRLEIQPLLQFSYVSPAALSITGFTPEEFYSSQDFCNTLIHPYDLDKFTLLVNNEIDISTPISLRWVGKSGKVIWTEQRNTPVFDELGGLVAIEGVTRDVTRRKQDENMQDVIYRIAQADASPLTIENIYNEIHRLIQRVIHAENFYIAIYNEKSDTISFPYFVDERDPPPQPRRAAKGLTEYVIRTGETLFCDIDLKKRLVEQGLVQKIGTPSAQWLGVPLIVDKKVIGVMATLHYTDPTAFGERDKFILEFVSGQIAKAIERKQRNEKILMLSNAVEQSPVSIVLTDTEGTTVYVNPEYCALTGYTFDETIGNNPRLLKSGKTPPETYVELWNRITAGESWQGEFINRKKNGELFIERALIKPIHDDLGSIVRFLAVKEDITERKRIEKELIEAKEKALESDTLKTSFLQNVSHEIRTPMNAIMGFSELLEFNLDDQEKMVAFARIIRQRSADLLGLISEILDIAQLESGKLAVYADKCDVGVLLNDILETFIVHRRQIEKEAIEFDLHSNSGDKLVIQTDMVKLRQVISNLLQNAFKFTDSGKISFGVHAIESEAIVFYVADTGKGIPTDKQQFLFQRFRKFSEEGVVENDGLGLGLAISKGLLDLLDGRIWFNTEQNRGSTFYISVPLKVIGDKPMPGIAPPLRKFDWSGKTILIVEDDPYNVAYLEELLEETNAVKLVATSANQAISLYKSNPHIDLVLMDIRLPEKSGYEVTPEIIRLNPNALIIAQTAYASATDRDKAIRAGCVDYISKPISKDKFFPLIEGYLIRKT